METQTEGTLPVYSAFMGHQSLLGDPLMLEDSVRGKEAPFADSIPLNAPFKSQQSLLSDSLRVEGSVADNRTKAAGNLPLDANEEGTIRREEQAGQGRRKDQEFTIGEKLGREFRREGREKRGLEQGRKEKEEEKEKGQGNKLELEGGLKKGRRGRNRSFTLGTLNPDENLSLTIGLDSMFNAGSSLLTSLLGLTAVLAIVGIGAGLIAAVADGW